MIQSLVVFLWLMACAVQDIRERQIANWLTLGAALLALGWLFTNGTTWLGAPGDEEWWGFALVLLLTLPGYAMGRFGAGDVKLLAALALASSVHCVLWSFVGATVSQLMWIVLWPRVWPLVSQRVRNRLGFLAPQPSTKLPFAPFLLVGFSLFKFWIH